MLNLVKPTYVMPFHGDYKRIQLHGQLAEAVGVAAGEHLQGRERPAAGDRREGRALRQARARRDDLRRRRRHRRRRRRRAARPPDAQRRRHLRRRRDDLRAGRLVGRRARGDLPRRAVPATRPRSCSTRSARPSRSLARAAEGGGPRDRPHPADAARRPRRSSSTTASSAGRWCCRSSSRSEPTLTRSQALRSSRSRRAVRRCADSASGAVPRARAGATGLDRPAGSGRRRHARQAHDEARARVRRPRASTPPPWASATARTIARPRPVEPPRSPSPRTKRSKIRVAQLRRDARAVVLDDRAATSSPSARRDARARGVPGGVWRIAFSIRLSASRCSSSRAPSTTAGVASTLEVVAAGDRPQLGGRLDERPAPRSVGLVRLLAVGVGAGEQQQVGDQAAHPPRRAQRRRGRLAALAVELVGQQLEVGQHARQRRAQLVRGVGDELALARAAPPRSRRARPRARRASRRACGASSATSSSASGWGTRLAGVARARDVARGGGQLGDRAHRAAAEQRRRRAARAACRRRRRRRGRARTRATRVLEVGERARVLDRDRQAERRDRPRSSARRASRRGSRRLAERRGRAAGSRGPGAFFVRRERSCRRGRGRG